MAGFQIHLVRHAIAEERGSRWPDDDLRPLTREGIRRFKEVVRGLARLDVELDLIITSPLVRARQTAELLAGGLTVGRSVRVVDELAPGTPLTEAVAGVLRLPGRRLAVVGHEPDLGRLAAFLIGARRPLPFKKGGVCRIDLLADTPRPRGTLVWCAPPALLRLAGRS